MKSLRQFYWFISSIVKKHKYTILVSTIVGVMATFNVNAILKIFPRSGSTYIGRAGNFNLAQLPLDIQYLISSGLTKTDETGLPQPDLAQSWQVLDEGRTYRLTLDPARFWQDGELVTSNNIDLSFQDVEVIKETDHTLEFRLNEPFSPFPTVLSQPLFRREKERRFLLVKRSEIIGTGEFRIRSISFKGSVISQLVLESDKQKLVYRFYPTEEEAVIAFKAGKVDRLENMSSIKGFENWENVEVVPKLHEDKYLTIFLDTTDQNLSSKAVRQALAYATPKSVDNKERAKGPVSSGSWAYNPQVKSYSYSMGEAKELLEGEMSDEGGPVVIELTSTPAYAHIAEEVADSWRELGFEVNLKIVNFPDTNQFQALLIGQQSPADPDQYTLWHSTQGTNFTRYNSPRVDKLLEDGRKTVDKDERTLIYQDFQRFLVEDTPAIFIDHLITYTIERQ